MSQAYGWTPEQINKLTLFQAAIYFGAITPEHGRLKLAPEQAREYLNHLRQQN